MLLTLPDVLPPDQVREVLTALEAGAFVDGRETAENEAALTKRNLQLSATSELRAALSRKISDRLMKNQIFLHATLPKAMTDFHFSRYEPGMEYGDHMDNAVMSLGTDSPMRSDLSMTLFLSDPSEYDGGELVVNSEIAPQAVKLPPGHCVIYPTTEFHRVAPVTRGTRRVAVCWIQSMVRRVAQREILTELWIAIDRIHGSIPPDKLNEHQAFRTLSKARLNLIRMWAEA